MPYRASGEPPATQITFSAEGATAVATDALVVVAPTGDGAWAGALAEVDAKLDGASRQALSDADYTAKIGKTHMLPTLGRLPAKRVIVTALPPSGATAEDVRRAYGAALSAARRAGARTVACQAPAGLADDVANYRAAVEGALLALYDFKAYKSDADDDAPQVKTVTFLASESDAARRGVAQGYAVASGVYLARDLVFEPGDVLYPETLAERARAMATQFELDYIVYDERQLAEMGAGAIVAVGKGSERPPRLVHMTYKPSGESRGTIALIGKGITFDTGGMDLKTADGMLTMKTDMAGAAAVVGAMRAIAELDLPFTVYGILSSAENMPSATAFRPGDVLRAMNGKTLEITSTDAEGRLVLADAMVYAARQGAEEMIDLATLTGAKVVALGAQSVAVFSNDDDFAQRVVAAGTEAGELFWHMPLWDELRDQISSEIADMQNTGGRGGGAITAALIMSHFTEGKLWTHLDIAGAAWAASDRPYVPKGPTGVGVRALVNYLEAKAAG